LRRQWPCAEPAHVCHRHVTVRRPRFEVHPARWRSGRRTRPGGGRVDRDPDDCLARARRPCGHSAARGWALFRRVRVHRLTCAGERGCHDGDAPLARAYGPGDAALMREHPPNLVYEPGERQLPVDYQSCRPPHCAEAPDDRDLDVHRALRSERATGFTRVVRPDGRIYIHYWRRRSSMWSATRGERRQAAADTISAAFRDGFSPHLRR
jgi:hypothetical protein